jgi:hypothetical protein
MSSQLETQPWIRGSAPQPAPAKRHIWMTLFVKGERRLGPVERTAALEAVLRGQGSRYKVLGAAITGARCYCILEVSSGDTLEPARRIRNHIAMSVQDRGHTSSPILNRRILAAPLEGRDELRRALDTLTRMPTLEEPHLADDYPWLFQSPAARLM